MVFYSLILDFSFKFITKGAHFCKLTIWIPYSLKKKKKGSYSTAIPYGTQNFLARISLIAVSNLYSHESG